MKKVSIYSLLAVNLSDQYGFSHFGDKPINSVSDVIAQLLPRAYQVAAVAVIFYFLVAAFRFIISGGNKESVANAQKMIAHSLIGVVMLIVLFVVLHFLFDILGLQGFTIL